MTTGRRITISQESVRLMLADWHAQFFKMTEPQRAQRVIDNERATAGEYAAATAGHIFSLLEKHAEPQS